MEKGKKETSEREKERGGTYAANSPSRCGGGDLQQPTTGSNDTAPDIHALDQRRLD